MSEIFEGIVVPSRQPPDVSGSPLILANAHAGTNAVVVFRDDPRNAAAFTDRMDDLARELSQLLGRALVVRFDSRIGHRSSALFEHGSLSRAFGEQEELFVPLDERGEPTAGAAPVRRWERDPDAEYETSKNAIQLGLEALGAGEWEQLFEVITAPPR